MRFVSFALTALVLSAGALVATPKAQAYLDVYPNRVHFFQQYVGEMSFNEYIYITNRYRRPVTMRFHDNCFGDFRIDEGSCLYALSPGRSCTLRIQFWPMTPGMKWCSVDINDRFGGWNRIDIQGEAIERPTPAPLPTPNP
ncbi:MAG: hypothetical protein AAB250_09510 [Bdellovibrionota bacterium]